MEKIKKLFQADAAYLENLHSFRLRDTLIAAVYYLLILAVYYIVGHMLAVMQLDFRLPMSIGFILLPVLLCFRSLSGLGLSRRNLTRSLIVSAVSGCIFLLAFSVIPNVFAGRHLLPVNRILYHIFFFFIMIGFSEEVGFRGFIQPRLFPLLKSEWLTVLAGGILFVFMHYPFQMAVRQMGFWDYLPKFIEQAPMQFLWHFVFTWFYRRYGNLYGSTVLHGLVDMTGGLFG